MGKPRQFWIEPAEYDPETLKDAPDGFDAIVHTTPFGTTIEVIELTNQIKNILVKAKIKLTE